MAAPKALVVGPVLPQIPLQVLLLLQSPNTKNEGASAPRGGRGQLAR